MIHALKDRIEQYNLQIQNEGGVSSPLYVSDRRWKKMVKLYYGTQLQLAVYMDAVISAFIARIF